MVSKKNKRVPVTISKSEYEYLKTITDIYNSEVITDNFRLLNKNYKISVSGLYKLAIQQLILNIDKQLNTKKSKVWNHKNIYLFLSGKETLKD